MPLANKIARPPAIERPRTPTRSGIDPRTRALLDGPIVATLLRLAAPNVLVMMVQASVGLIETYFIGWLGTDALAGVALVFPVLMLMQMMSAGAMGGGISSAISRALGAGRRADADALALHAFAGAILLWIFNSLANIIRGTGNMAVPAIVTCLGAVVLLPLSPSLIIGWGP